MRSFNGIKYRLDEPEKGRSNVTVTDQTFTFGFPCEESYSCTPYKLVLSPGYYSFELWGAQGGDARYGGTTIIREDSGGKGAYVAGNISLIGTTQMYLYIGGKGEDQTDWTDSRIMSRGGFNGGGNGGVDFCDVKYPESSAGGGGATDIRLIKGNDIESFKSRIIVAAGGGGASSTNTTGNVFMNYQGGDGGTINGTTSNKAALPGTQISGIFGYGQDGLNFTQENFTAGGSTGGGGGGYYGATSFLEDSLNKSRHQDSAGAGGSSYISGHKDCIAVKYEYSEENPVHSIDSIHFTNAYFEDPVMKMRDDPSDFPGHSGNGYAVITIIKSFDSVPMILTFQQKYWINHFAFTAIFLGSIYS